MAERAAEELTPGLRRWTAAHPAWHPDAEPDSPHDWDENVGCVLSTAGSDHAVFIDPLLPADADAFWRWCDDATGSRHVHVLTTIRFHGRSREAVAGRYHGEVVTSPDSWLEYLAEYEDELGLGTPPRTQADLRALLRPLLDLPVQRILVTHGEPLLSGGAQALRQILA